MAVCSVPTCGRRAICRTYCNAHYQRLLAGDVRAHVPLGERKDDTLVCTAPGCERHPGRSALCRQHRVRMRRQGRLEPVRGQLATLEVKLASRIMFGADDACWLWQGSLSRHGYGVIDMGREGRWYAHRLAWAVHTGTVPALTLDHLCRQPTCCNPRHLEEVTAAENTRRVRDYERFVEALSQRAFRIPMRSASVKIRYGRVPG